MWSVRCRSWVGLSLGMGERATGLAAECQTGGPLDPLWSAQGEQPCGGLGASCATVLILSTSGDRFISEHCSPDETRTGGGVGEPGDFATNAVSGTELLVGEHRRPDRR